MEECGHENRLFPPPGHRQADWYPGREGAKKLYTPDALLIMELIDGYFKKGMTAEEVKEELDREFPQLRGQKGADVKETECPDDL